MISFHATGSLSKTERFLAKLSRGSFYNAIEAQARAGVKALAAATPIDSGETANSWGYEVDYATDGVTITWTNSHQNDGTSIAIILQYGHGTGTGGYVQGRDYINPAIKPTFDNISKQVWKEVTQ